MVTADYVKFNDMGSRLTNYVLPQDSEGNDLPFVDKITPGYFLPISRGQYSYDHYMSVSYSLRFLHIMGLGALMSVERNGNPPYHLPEAAKQAFMVKKMYESDEDRQEDIVSERRVVLRKATQNVWDAEVNRAPEGIELAIALQEEIMARKSISMGKYLI